MKEKMIALIVNYRKKLNSYLLNGQCQDSLRGDIIKQIKIASLSLAVLRYDDQIEEFEMRYYFTGQVFVGRYFCDWGLDWVADNYYEMSHYILKYHCSQELLSDSYKGSVQEYIPFIMIESQEGI